VAGLEDVRVDSTNNGRTLALSDGVFAIALTLLVLTLPVPHLAPGHHGELFDALVDRTDQLFSWLLSFVVVGLLWIRHHQLFDRIDRLDTPLTWLNLGYLGGVAFLPYPTEILGSYGSEPAAVGLYAITIALVSAIGGLRAEHAARAGLLAGGAPSGASWWVVPLILLSAIPASFVLGAWSMLLWLGIALVRRWGR
jgi:uncharacterized membrane protein